MAANAAGKMAAAESKHNSESLEIIAKNDALAVEPSRKTDVYEFKVADLLFHVISISIFLGDALADSITFLEYLLHESFAWGYSTLALSVIPASIVQLFSLRWYRSDGFLKKSHWIMHFLFLGILHRYLILLSTTIHTLRNKQYAKDKNWVYRQESDVCMLRLFEAFMSGAPQLLLQLYIIIITNEASLWTSILAMASSCSVAWAVITYTKAMHETRFEESESNWLSLSLQIFWRCGMLISRIAVLLLMAVCMRQWFFLVFGLHWLSSTIWVVLQKTDLCLTVWEERIYNSIIGLIYCFDFFNLREGKSRYRMLAFYSIVITQNVVLLLAYAWYFEEKTRTDLLLVFTVTVVGGMATGLTSMLLYYWKFHPSVSLCENAKSNEIGVLPTSVRTDTPRVLKQHRHCPSTAVPYHPSMDLSREPAVLDETIADKQSLLRNIVHDVDCVEEGLANKNCVVQKDLQDVLRVISESKPSAVHSSREEETSENQMSKTEENAADCEQVSHEDVKVIYSQKRRSISLPISHCLEPEDRAASHGSEPGFTSQRRRGICSLAQLIVEIENGRENTAEKITPEDIDFGLGAGDGKKPPEGSLVEGNVKIHSLDILKYPQQREETMSCVTSIHDYENVCPLGVARPPWCIRSWKGYTDIETYLHDDSVVRDRRRDTLTSTATGTTYSSEFSDATCASCFMRGVLRNDDYSDVLTYDLLEPGGWTRSLAADDASTLTDDSASYFVAKPVMIDDKDAVVALDTIFEEHDETIPCERPSRDSVSTLVSTIDQIRRCTAENSPRHVYHRTESHWEDLDPKSLIKKARLTKISESAEKCSEKERSLIADENKINSEIDAIKELVRCRSMKAIKRTPLIEAILSDSPILGNKAKLQKHVSTMDADESGANDLYVEMSPLVTVTKGYPSTVVCPAIAETAQCRTPPLPKPPPKSLPGSRAADTPNEKRKRTANRCKRKFSLLRERFEPKSQRLVYVVSPKNSVSMEKSASERSTASEKDFPFKDTPDSSVACDKENFAPTVPSETNRSESVGSIYENNKLARRSRESKLVFPSRGLSPAKLFTWNKRKPIDLTARH